MKGGFVYTVRHWSKDGRLLDEFTVPNIMPMEGRDYLLGAGFAQASQIGAWYLGLYTANYVPTANDTLSSFLAVAGETVSSTAGSNRPTLAMDAIAQGVWSNVSNPLLLVFTAPVTVTGAFVTSSAPKGNAVGVLLSAVRFPVDKPISEAGEKLEIPAGITLLS